MGTTDSTPPHGRRALLPASQLLRLPEVCHCGFSNRWPQKRRTASFSDGVCERTSSDRKGLVGDNIAPDGLLSFEAIALRNICDEHSLPHRRAAEGLRLHFSSGLSPRISGEILLRRASSLTQHTFLVLFCLFSIFRISVSPFEEVRSHQGERKLRQCGEGGGSFRKGQLQSLKQGSALRQMKQPNQKTTNKNVVFVI